jgi:hypothetical protein
MSNFSWKVAVSILGLRLIPMKLMPQIYDRNARIKHRLFLMFAFYSVWLFIQLTLLVVWFTPLSCPSVRITFSAEFQPRFK